MLERPVKCRICNRPMYYSNHADFEPDEICVRLGYNLTGRLEEFYVHTRCWRKFMKELPQKEATP